MRTDNDWGQHIPASGWSASADSANVTQTASQGWFWSSSWQNWEREAEADLVAGRYETFNTDSAFLASLEEPKRCAQPLVLFLPLALLARLWRRLWRL